MNPDRISTLLQKIAFIAVCIMGICFPFSFAIFSIGSFVVVVAGLLRRFLEKDATSINLWMEISIILFLIAAVISVFQYPGPWDYKMLGINKLARYLLFFLMMCNVLKNQEQANWVYMSIASGGLIAGLDGVLQYVLGQDPLRGKTPDISFENLVRITGPFPNPNGFMIYLCILVPFIYTLLRFSKSHRPFFVTVLASVLIALVLTFSRTGILAIALCGLILILFKKDFLIILFGGLSFFAALLFLPVQIKDWFTGMWGNLYMLLVDTSRHNHHLTAWNMFLSRPWFGVGINTFDVHYIDFRPPGDPTIRWSAHHAYLQLLAETGIVGLISFVMILISILTVYFKRYFSLENRVLKAASFGSLLGTIAFLFIGFYESNLWQSRQTFFFWFWLGLLFNFLTLDKNKKFRKAVLYEK